MKRPAALFFTLLILLCSLVSCSGSGEKTSCRALIGAMTEREIGLPAGRFYSMTAPEGDKEYLSRSLISSLFGGGSYPKAAEGWLDAALYISLGSHPCEFAVILCQDRDVAHDTADLLNSRLSSIRLAKSDGKYAPYLQNASVTLVGNYALLIISSDTRTALKSFMKNK